MKARIAVIGLKGLPASGGAATVGENLILHLKDCFDFEVLSTATHAQEQLVNGISQVIFPAHKNAKINTLLYYFRCASFALFRRNYDLIHLHHAESGFIIPFLRLKYKVVTTYHGMFLDDYFDPKFSNLANRFFRFSQSLNLYFSTVNISVSKIDAEKVNQKVGRELVKFIPNGVSLPEIRNSRSGKGYICFAANRIYQIKGLHTLIEALRISGISKTLKVIGDLSHSHSYKKEIESASKHLNIDFIGKIHDKAILFEIISGADYFVFPSEKEAMPMMLLEVAALKVPVISSDIPEIRSVFNEAELIFFKSKSPESLAKKLKMIEEDPSIGRSYADHAYEKVSNEYQWERITNKYKVVFESLLKKT